MYADDLLVISLSPEGLQQSINVIKKQKRMKEKRSIQENLQHLLHQFFSELY